MAKDTGFFRGQGGTIFKMDLPLRENYQDQVDKGTLIPITEAVVEVEGGEGEGMHYRLAREVNEGPAETAAQGQAPEDPDAVPAGSIEKVLEWVGADKDRAASALDAEQAKGDKARSSLVKTLSEMLETA